jgi:uncharacterized protein (TIGR02466 family)
LGNSLGVEGADATPGESAAEKIPLDISNHVASAFATPIVSYPWPESDAINERLAQLILERESESEGIARSNIGGWHSGLDFFSWDADCVREIKDRVEQMTIALTRATMVMQQAKRTFKYRLDGWANVSRDGAYNNVHNHPNCLWSGVYYVSSGQADPGRPNNGKLELLDPRSGVNLIQVEGTIFSGRYLVEPIPGLMIMFPSWLNHLVHPFFGSGERISIAFNVLTSEVPTSD